jgi:hypothetical protein
MNTAKKQNSKSQDVQKPDLKVSKTEKGTTQQKPEVLQKAAEEEAKRKWEKQVNEIREKAREEAEAKMNAKLERLRQKDVTAVISAVKEMEALTKLLETVRNMKLELSGLTFDRTAGNGNLTITDSNGNSFNSANSSLIQKVVETLKENFDRKIGECEKDLKGLFLKKLNEL